MIFLPSSKSNDYLLSLIIGPFINVFSIDEIVEDGKNRWTMGRDNPKIRR